MNKKTIKDRVILRKITIIPLFLILVVALAFAQENIVKENRDATNDKNGLTFADEQKAALDEQKDSFQLSLANERKAAAEEQTDSFQKGLASERKAVAENQKHFTQQQLADERKAATEGTIVVGQKVENK